MDLLIRQAEYKQHEEGFIWEGGVCSICLPVPWPRTGTDSILQETDGKEELSDLGKACVHSLLRVGGQRN